MVGMRLRLSAVAALASLPLVLAQAATGGVDAGVPTGSTTDTSAYECDTDSCKLPDCHCASPEPPGGLSPSNTPQFVTWTSDDAMNIYTDAAVKRFLGNRQNPNGCPVKSTYFVSTMNHNYSLATDFYVNGNEVACHTVNHEQDSASDPDEISANIAIQNRWSGIPESHIKGFRAPFLSITADTFPILHDGDFNYDSSLPSSKPADADDTDAYWPYTLDYGLANRCLELDDICNGEPQLPGLWEIPMYPVFDGDTPIGVMDIWNTGDTEENFDLLRSTFESHYNGNRQPFGLYTHPTHLSQGEGTSADVDSDVIDALVELLDWIQDHDDVWFVTNEQLLEWMRDPKEASELDGLGYLDCEMPEVDAEICNGMESTQAGLLVDCPFGDPLQWGASSCYGCPSEVPDVGNPTPDQVEVEGQSQREPVSSDCPTVWWDPIKGECRCSGDECDVGRGGDDSAAAPMVHFAALILITAPLFAVLAVV